MNVNRLENIYLSKQNTLKIIYIKVYKALYKSLHYVSFIYAKITLNQITFLYKLSLKELILKDRLMLTLNLNRIICNDKTVE